MPTDRAAPDYVIRRFDSRDASALVAITDKSPEAAQWPEDNYASLLDHACLIWIAERAAKILGFAVARHVADEAELMNLAVDPANRRSGVASALLQAVVEELCRAKIQSIFLEVRASNAVAINFYEKSGFLHTGRRSAYYQHPTEDAVLMVRKLTA